MYERPLPRIVGSNAEKEDAMGVFWTIIAMLFMVGVLATVAFAFARIFMAGWHVGAR